MVFVKPLFIDARLAHKLKAESVNKGRQWYLFSSRVEHNEAQRRLHQSAYTKASGSQLALV